MAIQDTAVGRAVYAATPHQNTRIAMILGALLEGGSLNPPYGIGDNGTSFGPWQIHLPAHPGVTRAQAEDANWAARYMAPQYEKYTLAGPLGATMQAAANTAFKAERPKNMYPSSRVSAAWAKMHGQITGDSTGGQTVFGAQGSVGTPTGLPNPLSGVDRIAHDAEVAGKYLVSPTTWIRVGEFALGLVLIVAGLSIVAKPVTQPVAQAAVKAAGVIPK